MGRQRFLFDLAGLLIIAFLVTGAPAGAADITISPGLNAIQNAINAGTTNPGDTIILTVGTYTEHDITVSKDIIIRADTANGHGPADTIIDATNSGRIFDNTGGYALTIDNLTLYNGNAGSGGAIRSEGGTVIITSSTITGCTATNEGGAILNYGGTVTITGSTISDCTAVYGGAISSNGSIATITITGSTITGCPAAYGGAIRSISGTVTITGSTITGCSGTNGGAINNDGGTVIMTGTTIISCTAAVDGGAIYNTNNGAVTIQGSSTISDCSAENGGAIYNDGGTITVRNSSTISDCRALIWNGGAIYNDGGTVTITGSTFSGCSATGNGGTIHASGSGTVTIDTSGFTGNPLDYSANNGGAIYADSVTVSIDSTTFSDFSATQGGTIFTNGGTCTITATTFSGGWAGDDGGAIYNTGPLTITSSTFSGSGANMEGGAIENTGSLTVASSVFEDCRANNNGGAINNGGTLTMSGSTITGCSASYNGGGIDNGGTLTMSGSTITGCSATNNGGAIHSSGHLTVTSSTFTGNTAGAAGSAIYSTGSGSSVHFSRFYQNLHPVWDVVHSPTSIEAQNNWWGTNDNPGVQTGGYVNYEPWLVLGIAADPASISTAGTSAIRTNLTFNSTIGDTSGGGIFVPDDITNTFAIVSGSGVVLPLTDGTANGVAQTTFTPLYGETVNISGTVDDQTVYIEVPVAQTAPVPTDITPDTGVNTSAVAIMNLAGSSFTIYGTTAVNLTRAGLANITATFVTVVDNTQITCTLPITGAEAGEWDVVVINPNGQEGVLPGGFTVTAPAPAVTSVTPATGMNTSSITITDIAGTYFQTGATVLLTRSGYTDITATGITVIDPATITCTLPITGTEAGPWNVVVTNPDGQEAMLANGFTITAPAPTTVPTAVSTTYYPDDDSGNTLSDFPSSGFPLMTVIVNIGGDSNAWQAIVTGTKLSDLIVTGTVQSGAGGNFTTPPGIVFQYISLVPARYNTITNAVINFTVPQLWLEENHIDPTSIVLYRQTANGWEALPITVLYTKDGTVYFSAESGGFSLFAIAGTLTTVTPATVATTQGVMSDIIQEQSAAPTPVAKAPVITQTTVPLPAAQAPAGSSAFPVVPALIGIGCVGLAGGGWYIRRWWIRRQNPALFREYD